MTDELMHEYIARFAQKRINLSRKDARKHRRRAHRLSKLLEAKIQKNLAFDLVKVVHSGSVAKRTALRGVSDLDIAIYVRAGSTPMHDTEFLPKFIEQLKKVYPSMENEQINRYKRTVKVNFRRSPLSVDIVPVIYEGNGDYGWLVNRTSGERMCTNIPLHREFINRRSRYYGPNYKQLIRIVKWWKQVNNLKFKSYMIELLWAHLAPSTPLENYPLALKDFFAYIVDSGLKERIFFPDYYKAEDLPERRKSSIEIFDPINPENNVAEKYSRKGRVASIKAACKALVAITEAEQASTRAEAFKCWQTILGEEFKEKNC